MNEQGLCIPTWEPSGEYSLELLQVVRFPDGSKQFRIKLDGVTFDLGMHKGEVESVNQENLPNWYQYWLA